MNDRRLHKRIFVDPLFVAIKVSKESGTLMSPVMQINVSKGGASFLTEKNLLIGDEVYIHAVYDGLKITGIPAIVRSKKSVSEVSRVNVEFNLSIMNELKQKELQDFIDVISSDF